MLIYGDSKELVEFYSEWLFLDKVSIKIKVGYFSYVLI